MDPLARENCRMYQRGLASTADRPSMSGAGRHAIAFWQKRPTGLSAGSHPPGTRSVTGEQAVRGLTERRTMAGESIAPAFSAPLIDRVNGLELTGEFISTLTDIVYRQVRAIRTYVREQGAQAAEYGDWEEILTLLSLAETQVEIVRNTSRDFNAASIAEAGRISEVRRSAAA